MRALLARDPSLRVRRDQPDRRVVAITRTQLGQECLTALGTLARDALRGLGRALALVLLLAGIGQLGRQAVRARGKTLQLAGLHGTFLHGRQHRAADIGRLGVAVRERDHQRGQRTQTEIRVQRRGRLALDQVQVRIGRVLVLLLVDLERAVALTDLHGRVRGKVQLLVVRQCAVQHALGGLVIASGFVQRDERGHSAGCVRQLFNGADALGGLGQITYRSPSRAQPWSKQGRGR